MKIICSVLFLFILLTSCSKSDNDSAFEINGIFTHTIANCDNSTNPEINCSQYIWFNDDSTAIILLGGSDFGTLFTYKIIHNQIDFYSNTGYKMEISFKIIDEKNLKQMDNDNIWFKQE